MLHSADATTAATGTCLLCVLALGTGRQTTTSSLAVWPSHNQSLLYNAVSLVVVVVPTRSLAFLTSLSSARATLHALVTGGADTAHEK